MKRYVKCDGYEIVSSNPIQDAYDSCLNVLNSGQVDKQLHEYLYQTCRQIAVEYPIDTRGWQPAPTQAPTLEAEQEEE